MHLGTLQLDSRQVRTAVDFLTSYANFVLGDSVAVELDETAHADAATALRIAGQWAMLIDPGQALDLLANSAQIWRGMQFVIGGLPSCLWSPNVSYRTNCKG